MYKYAWETGEMATNTRIHTYTQRDIGLSSNLYNSISLPAILPRSGCNVFYNLLSEVKQAPSGRCLTPLSSSHTSVPTG